MTERSFAIAAAIAITTLSGTVAYLNSKEAPPPKIQGSKFEYPEKSTEQKRSVCFQTADGGQQCEE